MPKKGKKGKKKSVVVINPEITIVDEGESSLDVEDAIRQKNIALHTQPSIEIASEAQESRSVSVDSANAEMNSFTISEVTSMRKFDTLGVIGKKDSINSNFSFFSDNNLTATADLEKVEAHHFEETKITFSHFAESRATNLQSLESFDEEENLKIEELDEQEIQNGGTNLLMPPQDDTMHILREENIEWQDSERERITDQEDQTDSFLMEIEREVSEDSGQTEESRFQSFSSVESGEKDSFLKEIKKEVMEDNSQRKTVISWNNIQIKREIKLGLKVEMSDGQRKENILIRTELKENLIKHLENNVHQGHTKVFFYNGHDKISTESETETKIIPLEDCPLDFDKLDLHTYSDIFELVGTGHERRFIAFRHFLSLFNISDEEKDSLKILAFNQCNLESCKLLEPLYFNSVYALIEVEDLTSFLVVSKHQNLSLSTRIIPLADKLSDPLTLHLVAVAAGVSLRRIMMKNPSLKKCGYEHHVQMINDTEYSLELNGTKETIGVNLDKSVFSVVKSFNMDLGKHDFVDISLTFDAKILHHQTMLLYDKLRVEEEGPTYQVSEPPALDLSQIEIDENIFGKISNIEPLLASIRSGEYSVDQIEALLSSLGNVDSLKSPTDAGCVRTSIKGWKENDGEQSLKNLNVLMKKKYLNVVGEIESNFGVQNFC